MKNDELFVKLDRLEEEVEREQEDRVQMTSFEDDRDMYYATKDDKEAELRHLQLEYEKYTIISPLSHIIRQPINQTPKFWVPNVADILTGEPCPDRFQGV